MAHGTWHWAARTGVQAVVAIGPQIERSDVESFGAAVFHVSIRYRVSKLFLM